jgi:hypothetical protein
MVFVKQNVKIKTKTIIIESTFDDRCIQRAYHHEKIKKNNISNGFGCCICEKSPIFCPYLDSGQNCLCTVKCDYHYLYCPIKVYYSRNEIIEHMKTKHDLEISNEIYEFFQL